MSFYRAKPVTLFSKNQQQSLCRLLVLVSSLWATSPGSVAGAQPMWTESTNEQYVLTIGGLGTAIALRYTNANLSEPRWSVLLPFERGLRDSLRPSSREKIETLRDISDILLRTMLLAPYVVDMPIGVGRYGGRGWELGLIALQAEAFTMLVTEASKYLFSRARPYSYTCQDEEPDWRCASSSINESMISGHSAGAFSGAGLLCSFHTRGELTDSAALDYSICGVGLAVATTTALLRVATDDHHLTDVVIGSLVGLVIGYGLPIWLYDMGAAPTEDMELGATTSPLMFSYGTSF